MIMPGDLIQSLQKHLNIYSNIKQKYIKKLENIPKDVKEKYNLDFMLEIQKNVGERTYIETAYLLGFKRKTTYKALYATKLSEFAQAKDYVRLLYSFDAQMDKIINHCNENNKDIHSFYDYLNKLAE